MRRRIAALLACVACLLAGTADGGGATSSLLIGGGIGSTFPLPIVQQTALASFNFTAAFGSGPPSGDTLVAYAFENNCSGGGGAPQSPPSVAAGWTLIASRTSSGGGTPPGAILAYKIAGASEPASQTPFTGLSSPQPFGVAIVDLSNPSGQSWSAYSVTQQIVDGNNPGAAPITASPSVTPTSTTSLVLAFGGWISCGVGAGASALSITGGGTWSGTVTNFSTGASNDVSVLYSQQSVSGTSAISPSIQWTANNAPGLDGALIVFNHP